MFYTRIKVFDNSVFMDCFAALAMTDSFVIEYATSTNHRHCEERSDEAILKIILKLMTLGATR
jgi:hypothetical protein